jgi:hypothetical protein
LITLEGEYLTVTNYPGAVQFGDYPVKVFSAEDNKLEVFVPAREKYILSDVNLKISITCGLKTFKNPNDFTVKQSWWQGASPPEKLSDWQLSCSFSIDQTGYVLDDSSLFQYNAVSDSWVQKSKFPGDYRGEPFVFVVHGKAYIGAGIGSDPYYKQDMWEYDPVADSWKQKKDLPANFYSCAGFTINDFGFVVVGIYSYFWRYNPEEDSWTELSSCPAITTIPFHAFVVGTKAYITNYYGEIWEYDGINDSWAQKSNCGFNDLEFLFAINEKGYAWRYESQIYSYDPKTDYWKRIQDFPGYYADYFFTIGGKGFIGSLSNSAKDYFYYFIP